MNPDGTGIRGYGAYLPHWRLDRREIGSTLSSAGGRGTRASAGHDEDSTSMGVESARRALPGGARCDAVLFASTTPAYQDKTNATVIHAALALERDVGAHDVVGSIRSPAAALLAASDAAAAGRSTLAVLSDVRTGRPGSADERDGGDGAAAFLFGSGDGVVATVAGHGSASAELLDRWRVPGSDHSRVWEERFAVDVYTELAETAVAAACKHAATTLDEIDTVVVAGLHRRAVTAVGAAMRRAGREVLDDLAGQIGAAGAAQPGILLAHALDRAAPGEAILLVVVGDGADAFVVRATPALPAYRSGRATVAELAAAGAPVTYPRFLTWRGFLAPEPPRRPEPSSPAAPPTHRGADWKYGVQAGRCRACGTRHLPPSRVCRSCRAVDRMDTEPVGHLPARIATFTVDHLAYSPAPPVIAAVIDFEGGGRFLCELTDVDPSRVAIGDRVELAFRCLYTAGDGVRNYFWKARPIEAKGETT